MLKPSSRKHLLGQQVVSTEPISQRLSVRIPILLDKLIDQQAEAEGVSRNKWVSDAIVMFRKRHVIDRLRLPVMDEDGEGLSEEQLRLRHTDDVHRALAIMVKETFVTSTGGKSLPIRFTEAGMFAMQDLLDRLTASKVDVSHLTNVRTVLVHAALWDRVMQGREMQDVSALMVQMGLGRASNEQPDA